MGVGLIGSVAGCGGDTTDSAGSNDIVIWVRDTDATATITVENSSSEEVLFEETDTFSELLYPEDGPNKRYENVFGTETVRITFDVHDGPEGQRDFSDREYSEIHIRYQGTIEFWAPDRDDR
jgi:hypothetical protein